MQKGTGLLLEYLISMIESRDFFAEHHCEKVRKFTEIMLVKIRQFCPEYKLSVKECENIAFAAMMHDLGKMTIPDHILHKPGKLTFEEKQIMQNHTRKGRQIFEHIRQTLKKENAEYELFRCCAEVCMYHHERFDGGGYPQGLAVFVKVFFLFFCQPEGSFRQHPRFHSAPRFFDRPLWPEA